MQIAFGVVSILSAFVCYYIAKSNRRNETIAAILGLFFSLLAVIGYMLAGKRKTSRRKKRR